jgi:hypothetical protein
MNTSYVTLASFIYRGSASIGEFTEINVSSFLDGGTSYSIRIFDLTNTLQIAEITGQTNVTLQIISMGTLSNIPTGPAILQIQCLALGGGRKMILDNAEIVY